MWNESSGDGTLNRGRFRQCTGMCLAAEREKCGGRGVGEKEEHIIKASREDCSSSPGKMQPRSGQSCEAGNSMKGCKENELERLMRSYYKRP